MVRTEKYIRFSQVAEGFLWASLLFEKGIEKTVMWYLFSKTYPFFLTVKEGSTSHLGLLPSRKKRETAPQCYICPTCPSPAGGSLILSQALALSKRARDVAALRCSEPLRSKVVGPSKVFARLCGLGPPCYKWGLSGEQLY